MGMCAYPGGKLEVQGWVQDACSQGYHEQVVDEGPGVVVEDAAECLLRQIQRCKHVLQVRSHQHIVRCLHRNVSTCLHHAPPSALQWRSHLSAKCSRNNGTFLLHNLSCATYRTILSNRSGYSAQSQIKCIWTAYLPYHLPL